ncbi:uncharacterized protein EV154DRAFT_494687 [Mucor mucedo]|uniref:uncharacterized protein n=1 Tax=Mucor mucedo TaxID=29922 RepID=UPI002220E993|nr:uncharacterized protein EV154DRAFT_494687 [Mucor mucedo]KAI7895715.1 hypothetical protein EV154DRAFT_494687 [Mucor mucedo]
MSAFNNNNHNLNNTSAGIEGQGSNLASQGINRQQPNELNENHGIAATGLNNQPLDTHSSIPSTRGNDLNYAGANIADTRKVDQQAAYGNTAGQNLNSDSNRTGGTGIPPVNTAEHVRRNAAEEAISAGHHGTHHSGNNNLSHERELHNVGTGPTALGHHNEHSTGHNGVGLDEKTRIASHNATNVTHHHHPDDPVAVGPSSTPGQHHTGAPLGAGLPDQDLKHSTDKRHNEKHGNISHKEEETKVSAGDKIKGNLEKIVGKISGNEAKVAQGENIAQGRSV